jgi:hypothetical protein
VALKRRRAAQLKARRSKRRCRTRRPRGDERGVVRINEGEEGVRDGKELEDEGSSDVGDVGE